jgi:bifunctional non-homologous end joining protein LigD
MAADQIIDIDGKTLKLTNLDKVFYPAVGFTKGQVIDYYARIAPVLIPHLKNKPLTLKRYPNGVNQPPFFEKNATKYRPEWVKTVPIWSEGNQREVNYILANDLPTLIWVANLASIELHPSLSLAEDILCPRSIVFDLDPGPPASIVQCCQVALWLRTIFEHFQLASFPKTSGSKGMQVYVPLNTTTSYDETKPLAHALARLLENEHRDLVVADMKKAIRTNKVLVDWSQNDEHKTTISVYALRARERPTVSTPITWEEVDNCLKKKDAELLVFESQQTLARVEKHGDLFRPLLSLKQKLPKLPRIDPGEGAAVRAELERRAQSAGLPRKPSAQSSPSRRASPAARKPSKGRKGEVRKKDIIPRKPGS